jgi:RNA polymerase primary sigma factor
MNSVKTKKSSYTDNSTEEKILTQYMEDVGRYKPLSSVEEHELAKRIRKGDKKAAEKLIRANLTFVITVVNNYKNQGLPLLDLINIGNMGLIRAAKKFDERKNYKFISYAVWWIRQAVLGALADQSRALRIPMHCVSQIVSMRKIKEKIEREKQREAYPEEIEAALALKRPTALNKLISIDTPHLSLDTSSFDNGAPLVELMEGESDSPEDLVLKLSEKEDIKRKLGCLTTMEKKVICEYYGIDKEDAKTLADIGKKFRLTRERVRQIREQALKKLRACYKNSCRE